MGVKSCVHIGPSESSIPIWPGLYNENIPALWDN